MPKPLIKGANGASFSIICDENVQQQLLSPDADPRLKDMIVKMLIEQQKPEPQFDKPPPPAPPPTSQSDTAETDSPSSSESVGYVHVWKDKEEDMLVHLRHERQDLFLKSRNHGVLWQEISKELSQTFKTKITSTQALNKYNNLKKKWKEIIDAGTGTERKDFRLKEEFDLVFGTKPSSKPVLTLDSTANITNDNPSPPRSPQSTSPSSSPPKSQPNKGKQHPKKRKLHSSKSLLEELTTREKEFNSKIEKFHQEKMQRMDRFLDLFEKSIEKK